MITLTIQLLDDKYNVIDQIQDIDIYHNEDYNDKLIYFLIGKNINNYWVMAKRFFIMLKFREVSYDPTIVYDHYISYDELFMIDNNIIIAEILKQGIQKMENFNGNNNNN